MCPSGTAENLRCAAPRYARFARSWPSSASRLDRDDFSSNRHPALAFWWSTIFSENRFTLFGIMLCGPGGRLRPATGLVRLQREQQQQRDQQREDAHRFGHREAEDQVAELALRGRRVAQRGRQIVAEDRAHADAGAAHADAGNPRAHVLRGEWIHDGTPAWVLDGWFVRRASS